MKTVCVIGSGITGLSVSRLLVDKGYSVKIHEANAEPGGLIKCKIINGAVYHKVGGHVFNTKMPKVREWFNNVVDFENNFIPSERNAKILLKNKFINYPIENNIYQLDKKSITSIIEDLIHLKGPNINDNYEDFLKNSFGPTLYNIYFKPYNNKIWNLNLSLIPTEWLSGKLPMPDLKGIIESNFNRDSESEMVHSQFYYPKKNGSQYIVDKLSKNLDIIYNSEIKYINRVQNKWLVNNEKYDHIIYTGDLRKLKTLLSLDLDVGHFKSNGTTNIFCEIEKTDLSWLYIPELFFDCHRIIFSGNFAPNNNGIYKDTCTIEYSGFKSLNDIRKDILKLPFNIKVIDYNYEPLSYVIHTKKTKSIVLDIKKKLEKQDFHLLGRFAEWEYYNMDNAINAGMELVDNKF
jgi:protoporphyrinogen oxidase